MTANFNNSFTSLNRRDFVVKSAAALAIAATAPYAICEAPGGGEYVLAETKYGLLRGLKTGDLTTFKGVPYGGSVSSMARFKAAPPLKSWTGTRDALTVGAPSPQLGKTFDPAAYTPEDCLFLNIWTPAADGKRRPVMFYSHGGGFVSGSAATAYQDGGNLAVTQDVVVVATNHRLGLMGYLYLGELGGEEYATSGNQGILDIRDGLKWVKENIAAFGGDPNNVMIFGESGGGGKTSCLYAMPSAEDYFNKASIESGPALRIYPKESAAATALILLKQLGLEKSEWRKLLDLPVNTLLQAQAELDKTAGVGPRTQLGGRNGMYGNPTPGGFGPVLDGTIMPHHPFDPTAPAISKNKPLIVGNNRDEMNFFFGQTHSTDVYELTDTTLEARLRKEFGADGAPLLKAYRESRPNATAPDLYVAIQTAHMIQAGAIHIAERKYKQHGAPVYMYLFTHESDRLIPGTNHIMGAAHASEIAYKFDNIPQPRITGLALSATAGGAPQQTTAPSSEEMVKNIKAARNMSEMWSTFARTGHPGAKGQPAWPAYTEEKRATMLIDTECTVVNDPFAPERRIWEKLG